MRRTQETSSALAGAFRSQHRAGGKFLATLVSDAGTLTPRSAADRLLAGRANRRAGNGHNERRATHCTIGSMLYRGEIYLPTVATATRTRHVMKRSAVSLTLFRENELAIIVHGDAAIISPDHADFETLENMLYSSTHTKAGEWGEASTSTSWPRPSTPTTCIPANPPKAFHCR